MMSQSKRRRVISIISFLLIAAPFSTSAPLWRTWNKLIGEDGSRRHVNIANLKSCELLDEDKNGSYDWKCNSDDDGSYLLRNEPTFSPFMGLHLPRGGNTNARRKSNLFASIRGLSKNKMRDNARSQLQALQSLQRQKIIQFHKNFRKKQRQFQNSLYILNSQSNPYFPRPPYNLWRLEPGPGIGKTSLTGKIFMLNIAAFALQTAYPTLTAWGAKRSDLLLNGQQLHRLVTPIFLHGGIGHLMANSYSLKSMGMNVERSFGPARFLFAYFVSFQPCSGSIWCYFWIGGCILHIFE